MRKINSLWALPFEEVPMDHFAPDKSEMYQGQRCWVQLGSGAGEGQGEGGGDSQVPPGSSGQWWFLRPDKQNHPNDRLIGQIQDPGSDIFLPL